MPNLASARSRSSHGGGRGGDDEARTGGNNQAWYGIGASAVTLLVFCTLAATVGVWIAFASAGLSLVAFALASGLAPASWRVGANDAVSAESEAGAALAQRRFGLTEAAINALPTFPYELNGGDLEAGGGDMCSVCLEDVQAGDRVRQLPACRHLFHVECIDMWLHSHRTCPVCRCNLSPPEKVPGKTAAAAPAPAALATETEPPADNAESQV